MKRILSLFLAFGALTMTAISTAQTASDSTTVAGMISIKSANSVAKTIDKLEAVLAKKGITVIARVKHDASAEKVGIAVRPTQLLIFGNPALGSHFFTSQQTSAIDLPLKALAWQDEAGQVWLSYNDPAYIAHRHAITDRSEIIAKMTAAMQKLTAFASSK